MMERSTWKIASGAVVVGLALALLVSCSAERDAPVAGPDDDVEQQAADPSGSESETTAPDEEDAGQAEESVEEKTADLSPPDAAMRDVADAADDSSGNQPDDESPAAQTEVAEQPDGSSAQESQEEPPEEDVAESTAPAMEMPEIPDLGDPLVDNPDQLVRLDEKNPVWIDRAGNRVVMVGQVVQREVPLEMFACLFHTKEHEAIVAVPGPAYVVHAGLLAVGAVMGRPVQFDPEYIPATGQEIDVLIRYKDAEGKVQQAKAQDWIRNTRTGKAMELPFVFAGSGFWVDEQTGQRRYLAEGGDFICVSNFPSATLDLPVESSQANSQLLFEAFTERIPPVGTTVTMILEPVAGTGPEVGQLIESPDSAEPKAAAEDREGEQPPGELPSLPSTDPMDQATPDQAPDASDSDTASGAAKED